MNWLNRIPHERPDDWDLAPWSPEAGGKKYDYGWGAIPWKLEPQPKPTEEPKE